jgi:type III secretion protein U
MADQQDSGERTEEPTERRLRDARRRGDVGKSREVGATVGLLATLVVGSLVVGYAGAQLSALIELAIGSIDKPFDLAMRELGRAGAWALVGIVLSVAVPVGLLVLLAEFLQVGPVFSTEPLSPKLERLNPVEGLKRMFKAENLVELLKSLAKTALLGLIAWLVTREMFMRVSALHHGSAQAFGEALRTSTVLLLGWTVAIFSVVAVADVLYQRHAYLKKMRMSRDEIKREHKEDEGDPHIKGKRRQLHREWAENNAVLSTEQAHLLVMNPTHVAIALDYHPEKTPIPVVSAKGEDALAMEMRDRAQQHGVPVLRDISLARTLLYRAEVGEVVPDDLFDAVAQAIVWAKGVRDQAAAKAAKAAAD